MTDIQSHLRRFPRARPSTLAMIEIRRAKTEQLQREIEEAEIKKASGVFYPIRRAVRRLIGLGA